MPAKAKPTLVRMVPIRKVEVPKGRKRSVRSLEELSSSIGALGLINPITVTKDMVLVAGLHRLRACEALGWKEIPAVVLSLGQLDAELAEIDENLCRTELTVLERSRQTARRKEIYEAKHPETKRGGNRGNQHTKTQARQTDKPSFSRDTAAKTGQSTRTIERDVKIAEGISPEVADTIRDTPLADRKTDLLELAQMEDPAQQAKAAKLVVSGAAKTVAEAKGQLSADADPAVVRDELGTELVDPEIAEVFTILRPRMLEVLDRVRAGKRVWGHFHDEQVAAKRIRIVAAKGYQYVRPHIEQDTKNLGYLIHGGVPYALCPYCKGAPLAKDESKWCQACTGGGWVDKGTYDAAPPEMKVQPANRPASRRTEGVSHGR